MDKTIEIPIKEYSDLIIKAHAFDSYRNHLQKKIQTEDKCFIDEVEKILFLDEIPEAKD